MLGALRALLRPLRGDRGRGVVLREVLALVALALGRDVRRGDRARDAGGDRGLADRRRLVRHVLARVEADALLELAHLHELDRPALLDLRLRAAHRGEHDARPAEARRALGAGDRVELPLDVGVRVVLARLGLPRLAEGDREGLDGVAVVLLERQGEPARDRGERVRERLVGDLRERVAVGRVEGVGLLGGGDELLERHRRVQEQRVPGDDVEAAREVGDRGEDLDVEDLVLAVDGVHDGDTFRQ